MNTPAAATITIARMARAPSTGFRTPGGGPAGMGDMIGLGVVLDADAKATRAGWGWAAWAGGGPVKVNATTTSAARTRFLTTHLLAAG
jgi:hypothetical protein